MKTVAELLAEAQRKGQAERLESREWLCAKCRYQVSVTVGTV